MLEKDMADDPSSGSVVLVDMATNRATRSARLTYDRFLQYYWPHFPQTLTKGLGKLLCFDRRQGLSCAAKILLWFSVNSWVCQENPQIGLALMGALAGVIMSSEETLMGESSCLDRDAYLNLSERAQSSFASRRQRVYSLFESYLTRKRQLGDIDAADRTHAILRYLARRGVPGRKIHYL